jgi:hypothetical protein
LPSLDQVEQLLHWLFGDALSWANIVQFPALLLTGGVAWLLCHPVRARITAWIDRLPDRHRLDWLVQHRPVAIKRLVPLITPAVWATGLWISVSVAEYRGWPHAVAQVAVNLLVAWLVIRLAAEMVPNPVLARLVAVLAWSVAALNITQLLGPTLEMLDSAAIIVGGLRQFLGSLFVVEARSANWGGADDPELPGRPFRLNPARLPRLFALHCVRYGDSVITPPTQASRLCGARAGLGAHWTIRPGRL